jgi:hypothetical protein
MLICQSSCRGCFAVLAISARCMCRGERCSPVEVISPRQQQGSAAKNSPPTILNLQQILSTGEHCSPLQIIRESLSCRKIVTFGACAQLCSAMLIPHSSLLIPHLNPPLPLSQRNFPYPLVICFEI